MMDAWIWSSRILAELQMVAVVAVVLPVHPESVLRSMVHHHRRNRLSSRDPYWFCCNRVMEHLCARQNCRTTEVQVTSFWRTLMVTATSTSQKHHPRPL